MHGFLRSSIARYKAEAPRGQLRLGLLTILLIGAFLMGGSARSDVASLLFLRPLTAAIFVGAVMIALPAAWRRAPLAMAVAMAVLLLCLLHLLPLPPAIWSEFPGRQIAVDVYRGADMPLPWHPLTLTPRNTWNAAFSLLAPLSALILVLSLTPAHVQRILSILVGLAMLSASMGMLQSLGAEGLYWYEITNHGSAVGLFANRNHAALLLACTLPLLGLYTHTWERGEALARTKAWAAALAALVLIVMILLSGSRAGLAWAALAVPMTLWVHNSSGERSRLAAALPWIASVTIIGIAIAFVLGDRVPAVLRLDGTGGPSELRLSAAPAIWRAVSDYWPLGSGIGSFTEIYGIYEPQDLLGPAYLNHAHNDVLELLLTGGLPAVLIAVAGIITLIRAIATPQPHRPDCSETDAPRWGRAGLSVIVLLTLGSILDYPLRTPILAVFLAVAAGLVLRRNTSPRHLDGPDRS